MWALFDWLLVWGRWVGDWLAVAFFVGIVGAGVFWYGRGLLARGRCWLAGVDTVSFRLTAVVRVSRAGSFDNGDWLVGVLVGRVFMGRNWWVI